jgi:DNA-directed RNA polymerase subunit RPC12/RpoP
MADEYIKREAALKSVCYDCSLNENNPFCGIACADYERIKSIPAADVVPVRHGRWEVTPMYIKCSECGEPFMLIPQNFCPNCGAKMDVKK